MTEVLLLAFPAFVANMLPIVAARWNFLKFLSRPIHRALLGEHKTWRGFAVGICGACLVATIQTFFDSPYPRSLIDGVSFGILAGAGALMGDAAKSFLKRRLGIESGRPFIPFDQIDYMAGFLLFTSLMRSWTWGEVAFLMLCALVFNPFVNGAAHSLGIKKTYW